MVTVILYALATIWLAFAGYLVTHRRRRRRVKIQQRCPPYILVVTESGHLRRIWLSDYTHKDVVRLVRAIEDNNKRDDGDKS